MKLLSKYIFSALFLAASGGSATAQSMRANTYCNPLNVDYTYMIYNSSNNLSYRSGADPAVVEFRGEYYMFVTRSHGYWHSKDLLNWDFITPGKNWYPQGSNAPAAHNYKDSVLYVMGDPSGSMSVLYTDDPKSGNWNATPAILHDLQDPDLFIDDDGQAYLFWGSSNVYPLRGKKLNKDDRFLIEGETVELFGLDMPKHGWERFGENHTDTVLGGYMEGAWLTKHDGKYYIMIENRAENEDSFRQMYGGFLFLGIFLGILFLMITVLIIFYKQISEGYEDKERFAIMEKVGMSNEEVKKTISAQIRMVFLLPIVTAALHVLAAFPMIRMILAVMNLNNGRLFAYCLLGTIAVFTVIYLLVYKMTSRTYYRIVGHQIG